MIQIHHANAFEIIKDFYQQNLKVDAIITDPPYNISVKNHFSTLKNAKRQGIDFGEWDKNFKLLEWITRYAPLVNPNGCMIIFCSYGLKIIPCQEILTGAMSKTRNLPYGRLKRKLNGCLINPKMKNIYGP
ncbi:hypothetical protein MMM6_02140 [Helicobacter pylori]